MKIKVFFVSLFTCVLVVLCIFLIFISGNKPFKKLDVSDIKSVSAQFIPPNETIELKDFDKLVEYLNDIVIYNEDSSYGEYNGWAAIFYITKTDGTKIQVMPYNPFVVINGVGYTCKKEPCEELNNYAEKLLNDSRIINQ